MPMLEDTPEYMLGRWGEAFALALLIEWYWTVSTTCDYSGRCGGSSPGFHSKDHDKVIVPDMLLCKGGFSAWLDVKIKSRVNIYHNTGDTPEHGINNEHLVAYKNTQNTSGFPVAIAVIEMCSGMLLCNTLDALGQPRVYDGPNYTAMANWPRDSFLIVACLNREGLQRIIFKGGRTGTIRSPSKFEAKKDQLEYIIRQIFPCPEQNLEAQAAFERAIKYSGAGRYGGASSRAYAADLK